MTAAGGDTEPGFGPASCRVRTVLDRIGDKWAIYVVDRLGAGPRRFSELHRGIDGITAEEIARRAMAIAAGICIYTNDKITLEKLEY